MALLRSPALKKLFVAKSPLMCSAVRFAGGSPWVEDHMPGDFPKNEKERLAAAEKYGLLPHEYDTYDPNGIEANGDYPKLPNINAEKRDPYYPWDYPVYRKNYNEVWHEDWDMYTDDRYDPVYEFATPKWKMFLAFLSVMIGAYALEYYTYQWPLHRPVCEKQFPFKGETHYSFERGQK